MLSFCKIIFVKVFLLSLFLCFQCHAHVYTFTMHHRYSEPVRKWSHAAAGISSPPEKGTVEYYAELADRDRFLRGRKLSQIDAGLAFSDGNATFRISSLGFLHYTTVQLGTPGVKFMVALDTGSDLFWVPCDCTRCAATDGTAFASALASDFDLNVYNPNGSSTSKKVTCNNSLCILCSLFLWASAVVVLADERSLSLIQNTTLQLTRGLPVGNSPGSKPGTTVVVERLHIHGLSRFRNLGKLAHSLKVMVSPKNSNVRLPNIEVCFHRNASLAVGMCPHGQWEKVVKGSWVRPMSPFDHKLLDVRTVAGSTLENVEVSIEEEFFVYRIVLLSLGIILMSLALPLSKSLAFYYSSAMAIGIILVILIILYQGMKLLPTGRKSSLAIFLYSSAVGFGTFLLRYIPGLVRSVLTELGIDEDMYNPLAVFLLTFVAIAGAWLGFLVVHKLVLTEDGSVDISTAQFVAWTLRILAAIMILQSSMDPLLGTLALLCASLVSLLKRMCRLRFLRHLRRSLFKSPKKSRRRHQVPDSSPFDDSPDEHMHKMQRKDATLYQPPLKGFTLSPCKSAPGFTRTPPKTLKELYPSIIHNTPERKRYSAAEWDAFTKESTEKALEELVASPDFSKWLSTNADRITVTPNSRTDRRRGWLLWS